MAQPVLRIFSYQPNPRIYKASVAARLCGVTIEVRGAKPHELADWLWDFDAQPLSDTVREQHAEAAREARTGFAGVLYKTDAFLTAHPYGTVPAAFSADGSTGIFESNSIMRAVVRSVEGAGGLYGSDAPSSARIDSFLDVSLIFARDSQVYLLGLLRKQVQAETYHQCREALYHWLGGIERALANPGPYIAGPELSLADICFACEMLLMSNELVNRDQLAELDLEPMLGASLRADFPNAYAHFERLSQHSAFTPDFAPYLEKIAANASPF